jgi:hypothetical protein
MCKAALWLSAYTHSSWQGSSAEILLHCSLMRTTSEVIYTTTQTMRLINCTTYELKEFFSWHIPRYAILSHTWGDDEVSFADLTLGKATAARKRGFRKIQYTCQQATYDKLEYAWVDTCCIDKSSSAELSEAINSMYSWYKASAICYAYLFDVTEAGFSTTFAASKWFTRGWTLQEILAPANVVFYDKSWARLGTKIQHLERITSITRIDRLALSNEKNLNSFCVAQRMSWASRRQTTRVEDMTYALLGIFDINMPMLYGEGHKAFIRLQEEIIRRSGDDSIFAWGLSDEEQSSRELSSTNTLQRIFTDKTERDYSILAPSPMAFKNSGGLRHATLARSTFSSTNIGMQIELHLYELPPETHELYLRGWIGILGCSFANDESYVGIILHSKAARGGNGGPLLLVNAAVNYPTYAIHTIAVSVAVGMQSQFRKAIIVDGERDAWLTRNNDSTERVQNSSKVSVHTTTALLGTGYRIGACGGHPMDYGRVYMRGDYTRWDPGTMILHLRSLDEEQALLYFDLVGREKEPHDLTVTLHASTGKYMVRKRQLSAYDLNDRSTGELCDWTNREWQNKTDNMMVLMEDNGILRKIVVMVVAKLIYGCRVYQLTIDAAPAESDPQGALQDGMQTESEDTWEDTSEDELQDVPKPIVQDLSQQLLQCRSRYDSQCHWQLQSQDKPNETTRDQPRRDWEDELQDQWRDELAAVNQAISNTT